MFFASLAMLPEAHRGITMCISALAGASAFYRRFGFETHTKDRAPEGYLREFAVLPVACFTSRRCRILLAGANVTLPTLPYTIPFVSEPTNRTSPL
jgi:hypothetical protein